MKKLFLDFIINKDNIISVAGDEYHHLTKSLRIKIGETLILEDSSQKEFYCKITDIDSSHIFLEILSDSLPEKKKRFFLTLYFPILKGDRTEYLLQKSTEIGVDYFIPLLTQNTIVKLTGKEKNKLNRWNNIIKEAAMQSGRKGIPFLAQPTLLEEIKPIIQKNELGLIGSFNSPSIRELLFSPFPYEKVKVIVGPEGDLTKMEIACLKEKHFTCVNLSDNILRSETACIFFSSILSIYNTL